MEDKQWKMFLEMCKQQDALREEYLKQKRTYKYDKGKEEKRRYKEAHSLTNN